MVVTRSQVEETGEQNTTDMQDLDATEDSIVSGQTLEGPTGPMPVDHVPTYIHADVNPVHVTTELEEVPSSVGSQASHPLSDRDSMQERGMYTSANSHGQPQTTEVGRRTWGPSGSMAYATGSGSLSSSGGNTWRPADRPPRSTYENRYFNTREASTQDWDRFEREWQGQPTRAGQPDPLSDPLRVMSSEARNFDPQNHVTRENVAREYSDRDRVLQSMLDRGVIEPSRSRWQDPPTPSWGPIRYPSRDYAPETTGPVQVQSSDHS